MRWILHLVLGALIGAVTGWALYAGFYLEFKELGGTFGIRALREPVPKSFWRVSSYVALIGGLIGIVIAVWMIV